jgi:SNF2 family DNA or RNA helicase
MVFYSISFSSEEDYQAVKRIERASQKNAMFVYYLLCEESVDEYEYEVIQRKQEDQEALIDGSSGTEVAQVMWQKLTDHLREKYPGLAKKRPPKKITKEGAHGFEGQA